MFSTSQLMQMHNHKKTKKQNEEDNSNLQFVCGHFTTIHLRVHAFYFPEYIRGVSFEGHSAGLRGCHSTTRTFAEASPSHFFSQDVRQRYVAAILHQELGWHDAFTEG